MSNFDACFHNFIAFSFFIAQGFFLTIKVKILIIARLHIQSQ